MRTSVVAPYCSYLRVYEPFDAFSPADRAAWSDVGSDETAGTEETGALALAEQRDALAALLPLPAAGQASGRRQAYTLHVDGQTYVCPVEAVLRTRLALAEFVVSTPDTVLEALIPAGALDQVDAELLRESTESVDDDPADRAAPDLAPHILTARWHVPLAWFVGFADDERSLGTEPVRELRYRTPMVEARRRIGRAYSVLRRTQLDLSLDPLTSLGRWIENFHPHSWVELDYGGLVHLVDANALAADRSAADVYEALQALRNGDSVCAAAVYGRLMKRWRTLRMRERAT